MGKVLQFPGTQAKTEKIIKASDNGERTRVLVEDESRVLVESLKDGTWYLLRKTGGNHYIGIGTARKERAAPSTN